MAGSARLNAAFEACKAKGTAAFVGFVTAGIFRFKVKPPLISPSLGYPTIKDTVGILLGLQEGGCDIIELGIKQNQPHQNPETKNRERENALDGSNQHPLGSPCPNTCL